MIDLEKGVVYPGFMDAHLHLVWYGKSMEILDLVGPKGCGRNYRQSFPGYNGSEQWIIGRGWDQKTGK
ncbi:MAG: hypothetical protein CM1200mP10_19350 [Candidatus Neomarinimicrobiota bacterium]|nr:MAG: hypothetical protein CM1200mP10_19350 [Candidatus Neomarinimicrobiota bacterium]